MAKKKNSLIELPKDLLIGGAGLTLGSAAIGKLPATPATAGVQRGFTTASGFFPTFATLGVLKITKEQFGNIKFKKMKGGIL